MTDRKYDINGWYEVKENPLSKVGVFPYTGAMIDPNGELGLDPKKVYNVMRPKEELADPETIESFKLVPWIDEHIMLGEKKNGLTPAEEKGISGVIGENVFFDDKDQMLKGNVKVFAEGLKDDIEKGKKELSLGYRCKYEKESGIFNGQGYDFVQKCIRGNHMASVDEGRMGSEVAVLDGNLLTFTIDTKELIMTPEEKKKAEDEAAAKKKAEDEAKEKKKAEGEAEAKKKAEDEAAAKKAEDEAEAKKKAEDEEEEEKKKEAGGMDSLKADNASLTTQVEKLIATVDGLQNNGMKILMGEISKRDSLAESLSQHIGTFDHAEMTLDEVAVYGAEKLELKCEKGSELATLAGFLHNRQPLTTGHGLDSKTTGQGMDGLDDYIKGGKK